MDIRIISDTHWLIQLNHNEIQDIRKVAAFNKKQPTDWLREFILRAIKTYTNKYL